MLLHLSFLLNFLLPFLGVVALVLIWQLGREHFPELDVHARNALNWLISSVIYALGCALFIGCGVGVPALIGLVASAAVFSIIAGIKANQGIVWKYPLALTLLK